MFSYYGSKSKVVNLYPKPKFGKIIEPFAGSARYSLKYFDRDVLLMDKYEVIVKVWHYLQHATPTEIMGLPEPGYHEDLRKYQLSEGERLLLGFLANRGSATPCNLINNYSDIAAAKKQIAEQLYKIRHWKIVIGDYAGIQNEDATWFIDPPYQKGGYKYYVNEIDYSSLAEWCKSRNGQVIVCENTAADWLQFYEMRDMTGQVFTTTEAIWSNYPHNFMARQPQLFDAK